MSFIRISYHLGVLENELGGTTTALPLPAPRAFQACGQVELTTLKIVKSHQQSSKSHQQSSNSQESIKTVKSSQKTSKIVKPLMLPKTSKIAKIVKNRQKRQKWSTCLKNCQTSANIVKNRHKSRQKLSKIV